MDARILDFAIEQGYSGVKKGKDWNGYEVYIPHYSSNKTAYVGYPLVILVKDGEIRMSDLDESIEYLNFTDPLEETDI